MAIVRMADVPWFLKRVSEGGFCEVMFWLRMWLRWLGIGALVLYSLGMVMERIMSIRQGMMLLVCTVIRTYAGIFRVRSIDLYLIDDAVCWWNLRESRCPLVSFFVGYEFDC